MEMGEGYRFPGSLAYAINKPVNILSLEQQQGKGLDSSPEVRLAGNKVRGYNKLGQPDRLEDSLK